MSLVSEDFWRHRARHFAALARMDKPIGTYLLLWPTLTALWMAADGFPGWHLFSVFALGVFLTRSAGCVLNDLADMQFDPHVKRTMERPLATGVINRREAWLFTGILLLPALVLVLTTNLVTIAMSFAAVAIAAAYPLMKRYTHFAQAVLGVAFSWGILMAFTAVHGELGFIAWLLLAANLLWVVAYDTEYAMVDRDDDLTLGLKSTAILFGKHDRASIGALQVGFILCMALVWWLTELSFVFLLGLGIAAALLARQHWLIQDRSREGCFEAFLANHWVGFCIFAGTLADYAARAMLQGKL